MEILEHLEDYLTMIVIILILVNIAWLSIKALLLGVILKDAAKFLSADLASRTNDAIYDAINAIEEPVIQPIPSTLSSASGEILKLKQLLDMGAITQEEFDSKKKELLNL